MKEPTQADFRAVLEEIPDFHEYESCIECIVDGAPHDRSYESMVAALAPQMDAAIAKLNGSRSVAVLLSVALAKLIEARRGFPA